MTKVYILCLFRCWFFHIPYMGLILKEDKVLIKMVREKVTGKKLSPEALRALEEAKERREAQEQFQAEAEIGGRKGPDPVRYGDWEKKGIASDF